MSKIKLHSVRLHMAHPVILHIICGIKLINYNLTISRIVKVIEQGSNVSVIPNTPFFYSFISLLKWYSLYETLIIILVIPHPFVKVIEQGSNVDLECVHLDNATAAVSWAWPTYAGLNSGSSNSAFPVPLILLEWNENAIQWVRFYWEKIWLWPLILVLSKLL